MKKIILFLAPVLIFVLFTFLGNRIFQSGAMNPSTMVILIPLIIFLLILARPKPKKDHAASEAALSILGDFAKNAFADNEKLSNKFQAAVAAYMNNRPKAAINALEKLQSQCQTDADTYAVCVAMGLAKIAVNDYYAAIKLYNKAVVVYPTTELAAAIGSCQQRLGELKQAKDSYTFALELDPENLDARSKLATAYVADGDFDEAIEEALLVLDKDENHASALATCAICYGLLGDSLLYKSYTEKAVANGYKEDKIKNTVSTLKK